MTTVPVKVMTVAGSDSGGGAGIQADLKTFAALGAYGTSVLAAITAQNTREVSAIAEVPDEVVIAQIDTVIEDIGADAVKTGMLSSSSIIQNTADRLEAWGIPLLVVDPVMIAKSGTQLLHRDAIHALKNDLLPSASVITPNIPEAEVLSGHTIHSPDAVETAAKAISELGPRTVVVKGGHLPGDPIDTVYRDGVITRLEGERISTKNTHGTGCTFAAAIATFLAHGVDELEAVRLAKVYIEAALRASYAVGEGHSPVNHFVPLPQEIRAVIEQAATV